MTHIWAIGDLHLSFGIPNKEMDPFGDDWKDHANRVAENWAKKIGTEDLVLLPGDISWATHLDDALADLEWIDKLPGKKLMIRGNHDYWWSSPAKIRKALPPSIEIIQNNATTWNGIAIGGSRLWDCKEVKFPNEIEFTENPTISTPPPADKRENKRKAEEMEKIYSRELNRLELSLKELDQEANLRIAMTHYPPVDAQMNPSRASEILERHKVDICVFGHLHSVKREMPLFGEKSGIRYQLTSCDYIKCDPLLIL